MLGYRILENSAVLYTSYKCFLTKLYFPLYPSGVDLSQIRDSHPPRVYR